MKNKIHFFHNGRTKNSAKKAIDLGRWNLIFQRFMVLEAGLEISPARQVTIDHRLIYI